jgi:hypothetical protein
LVGAKYRHKADFAALLAFGPISPEALRLASDAGIVLLSGRDLSDFLEGKVLLDPSNLGRSTNLSSRQSELP